MLDLPKGSPNKCLRPPRGNKTSQGRIWYCKMHQSSSSCWVLSTVNFIGEENLTFAASEVLDQCLYHLGKQPRQQSLRRHTLKTTLHTSPCPHIQFLNLGPFSCPQSPSGSFLVNQLHPVPAGLVLPGGCCLTKPTRAVLCHGLLLSVTLLFTQPQGLPSTQAYSPLPTSEGLLTEPRFDCLQLFCSLPTPHRLWAPAKLDFFTIWEHMFPLPKITYIHLHLSRSVLEGLFNE